MLLEILSCLSILKDQVEYGSPRMLSQSHFAIGSQKSNDVIFFANSNNTYECKSSLPLNQNLTLSFSPRLSGLDSKLTFIYSKKPQLEDAQKKNPQIYKPTANQLFRHEQIHQINPFVQTDFPVSYLECKILKSNDESAEKAFTLAAQTEIKDVLADWSEAMDAEDYGYDKKSTQREADKLKLTEKIRADLQTCATSPQLQSTTAEVAGLLDRYIQSKKSAGSKSSKNAQVSDSFKTKDQTKRNQNNKSSVPTGQ